MAWLLEQNVDRGICGSWYLQKGRGSTWFVVVRGMGSNFCQEKSLCSVCCSWDDSSSIFSLDLRYRYPGSTRVLHVQHVGCTGVGN